MGLLQISEPGMDFEPHKRNIAIGIDLGTTNSVVASVKSGEASILISQMNERLVPSVVHYLPGITQVGTVAAAQKTIDGANTISSIKRFMGCAMSDLDSNIVYPYKFVNLDNTIRIHTCDGDKTAVEVSADILKYMKQIAVDNLGEEPTGVVITVPAYFDDAQRQATKQAAELAGLKLLRLLNEPTAAAIAYGLDAKADGTFVVYDLGGGTLDVSILQLSKGVFEVLAVNGDTKLGGDDFDHRLYCYILEKSNITKLSDMDRAVLLEQAKKIKEQLTTLEKVAISAVLSHKHIVNLTITREEFYQLSDNLVKKALQPLKKALRDANLDKESIDEVILVGGSTRMLNIRSQIENFFGFAPLTSVNPDEVVAIGAALQADVLAGNKRDDWQLLDVSPLSLGIETMGGLVEKIIPRNSTIPVTRAQEFTTYKDGQTAMTVHVVQGEREMVADCRSLAKFTLRGIPPMVAGQARILITYQIDADGLLSVSAKEASTGISSSIEIKPSFGLQSDEISQMIKSSIVNAKEDVQKRMYQEAIVDATALGDAIVEAISVDKELLSNSEEALLTMLLEQLRDLIAMPVNEDLLAQKAQLLAKVEQLKNASNTFAARRMNKAVASALSGKNVNEL